MRLRYLFILFAIFFASIGAKAQDYGAQIGNTKYATINEALSYLCYNGYGGKFTIDVLKDQKVTSSIALNMNNTITINGNGHTLTSESAYWQVPNQSVLILKDVNIEYKGTKNNGFITLTENGKLYVYNGKFHSTDYDIIHCADHPNARIYIYGGEYSVDSYKYSCIYANNKDNVRVYGGTFNDHGISTNQTKFYPGVFQPDGYTYYLYGLPNKKPFEQDNTDLTNVKPCNKKLTECSWHNHDNHINKVHLTGPGYNDDYCSIDYAVQLINAARNGGDFTLKLIGDITDRMPTLEIKNAKANVTLDLNGCRLECSSEALDPAVTVTEGKLTITDTSKSWNSKMGYLDNFWVNANGHLVITRGSFPRNAYVSKYIEECCMLGSDSQGRFYVYDYYLAKIGSNKYETLQAAFNAARDGETVTLLKDINEQTGVLSKSITLNSNNTEGRTILRDIEVGSEKSLTLGNVICPTITLHNSNLSMNHSKAKINKVRIVHKDGTFNGINGICQTIVNSSQGTINLTGGAYGEDVNKYLKGNYVATYDPSGDKLYHVTNKTPDEKDITVSLKKSDGSITGYANLGDAVKASGSDQSPVFTVLKYTIEGNDRITIPANVNAIIKSKSSDERPSINLGAAIVVNGSLNMDHIWTVWKEGTPLDPYFFIVDGNCLSLNDSKIEHRCPEYEIYVKKGSLIVEGSINCPVYSICMDDNTSLTVKGCSVVKLTHGKGCNISFEGGVWYFDPANHCGEPSHMAKGLVSKKISDNPVKYTVGTGDDACFEVVETHDKYSSFEAAVKSLSVKTASINILKDYTLSGLTNINNGYNITLTGGKDKCLTLNNDLQINGTLNAKDIRVTANGDHCIGVFTGGILNIGDKDSDPELQRVTVNGGTVNVASGTLTSLKANINTNVVVKGCKAFSIDEINSTGSIFTIEGGNNIKLPSAERPTNATFNITGGTFITNSPANYLAPSYYAEPVSGESSKWTVKAGYVAQVGDVKYTTLAQAVNAVTATTQTDVVLLADYKMADDEEVTIGKNIKLKGVTNNLALTINKSFSVANSGSLTLENINVSSPDNSNYIVLKNGSALNIADEKVKVSGIATGEGATESAKATINISKGEVSKIIFTAGHNYNITGGTFGMDVNDYLTGQYVADHDVTTEHPNPPYVVTNGNGNGYKLYLEKDDGYRHGFYLLTDAMDKVGSSKNLTIKLLAECSDGRQINIPAGINANIYGGDIWMNLSKPIQVAGTLTINGGKISVDNTVIPAFNTGEFIFVGDYGSNNADGAVLNINGTTISKGNNNISSVNITKGKLNIYGGKFKDIKVKGTTDDSKKPVVNISGGEIAELNITGKPKVNIYGGVLDALKHDDGIKTAGEGHETDYINIEGGYFLFDPKDEETNDGTHNHTKYGASDPLPSGHEHAGYHEITPGSGNNNYAVYINNSDDATYFSSFESAMGYANSVSSKVTIALEKDNLETNNYTTVSKNKNITIDANGKTFTLTHAINVGGKLMVMNGTFAGDGSMSGIGVGDGGELTIDNGGNVANVNVQGGTLYMRSGTCTTLTARETGSKCYIVGGTTTTVNSSNGANVFIAHADGSTATVGTINNEAKLSITSGTVNNLYAKANSETSISSNEPVVTIKATEGNSYGKISISGGNSITLPLPESDKSIIENIRANFSITGGKFVTNNPNPYINPNDTYYGTWSASNEKWEVSNGFSAKVGDVKYRTLSEAADYVHSHSDEATTTITLLADIVEPSTTNLSTKTNKQNIILDGNGHRLNYDGHRMEETILCVKTNVELRNIRIVGGREEFPVYLTAKGLVINGGTVLINDENVNVDYISLRQGKLSVRDGIVHDYLKYGQFDIDITGGAFGKDVTSDLKEDYVAEYTPGTGGENPYHVRNGFNLFLQKANGTIKGYTSLVTAMADADNGSVLTLLNKCVETNEVAIDKEVDIKVRTNNPKQESGIVSVTKPMVVSANVTITDVQLESGAGFSGSEMVNINNNSTLTLNGETTLPNNNGAAIANPRTSVKVSSGRLYVKDDAVCPTIDMANQTSLYVDGGKVYDLKHGDNCFIQISDGSWHFNPELHADCHGNSHAAEGVIVSAPDADGWYTKADDGIFTVTYGDMTTKHNSFEGAIWAIPFNYTEAAIDIKGDYTTTQSVTIPLNYTLTLTGTEGKTLTIANNLALNINGGLIVNSGTIANGWVNIDGGKLQITGGSIANLSGSNNATLDINGGTVQNLSADNSAVNLNAGTVNTLSGTQKASLVLNSGVCDKVTTDTEAIFTMDTNSTAGVGSFTFGNRANVTIMGGKFKVDPNEYTDQSYFAPYDPQAEQGYYYTVESGYVAKVIIDGTVYKFKSLADAIAALNDAKVNTATLVLEVDYEVQNAGELVVPSGKDITILGRDIYGKTYAEREEHTVVFRSPVRVAGKLTIKDGTYQTGSAFANDGNNKYFYVVSGGRLIIKRGTIDANYTQETVSGSKGSRAAAANYASAITVENGGALEIYGGTFRGSTAAESDSYGLVVNGNDVDIQLSGGTFSGNAYTSDLGGAIAWGSTSLTMDDLLFPGSMMYRPYDAYNIYTTTDRFIDGSIAVRNAVIPYLHFNTMIAPDDLTFQYTQVRAFVPVLTTDADGNNAIELKETAFVKKGTPVVIYSEVGNGYSIPLSDEPVEPSAGNLLTACWQETQVESDKDNVIYLLTEVDKESKFVALTNIPATVARGRAYISLPYDVAKNGITFIGPDGIPNLNPENPDIPAGITDITAADDLNAPTYNLAGQRIDSTTRHRGVIIRNGRKIVNK